jgi:hypothetical protein
VTSHRGYVGVKILATNFLSIATVRCFSKR